MQIKELLEKIKETQSCKLLEKEDWNNISNLPEDILYFFNNYGGIELFLDKPYGIKIVGGHNFNKSNNVIFPKDSIMWDYIDNDISNDWYIIAKSEQLGQYISIDLNEERIGQCYDSFIETHTDPDFTFIIAKSFTELLENLYYSKGEYWFWLNKNFKNYGNPYE